MIPRIYLAGPDVFYPDPFVQSRQLKEICTAHGMEGVFPMDAGLDISQMSKHQAAQAIYQANIELINGCDGMIANMEMFRGPGMDGGTAFEMGYATARGLPVVGYGARLSYLERTGSYYQGLEKQGELELDPSGLTVEDFDLVDNLMMACSAHQIVKTAQEAVIVLKSLVSKD
ncbi:nucleoside 2-deoxyribosyltransferase [Terasakiella sp. SH-1]|uniref:nucleoside 2-deoxyribosyltransferase n=1 Tax=Terasakiella sp. SH-1 TaxID=2560057 RepID=UPI0010744818|nr:nucleoside 2-deoxyribosyltransferase [Terasakiella sp. SH-1]